jgi:hypothetical protein
LNTGTTRVILAMAAGPPPPFALGAQAKARAARGAT